MIRLVGSTSGTAALIRKRCRPSTMARLPSSSASLLASSSAATRFQSSQSSMHEEATEEVTTTERERSSSALSAGNPKHDALSGPERQREMMSQVFLNRPPSTISSSAAAQASSISENSSRGTPLASRSQSSQPRTDSMKNKRRNPKPTKQNKNNRQPSSRHRSDPLKFLDSINLSPDRQKRNDASAVTVPSPWTNKTAGRLPSSSLSGSNLSTTNLINRFSRDTPNNRPTGEIKSTLFEFPWRTEPQKDADSLSSQPLQTVPRSAVVPRSQLPLSSLAAAATSKSPFSLTSDSTESTTTQTLSEMIRELQLKNDRHRAELEAKRQSSPAGIKNDLPEPLPKWRQFRDHASLRDLRKQEREQRLQQRYAPIPDFAKSRNDQYGKSSKPTFVDPKQQVVTIPPYAVSLAEASLLFREKTRTLLRKLRQLGESTAARKDTMIEPATMELLALELNQKVEIAESKGDLSDDHILIQRRAEQDAAVDDAYSALPPRAPVVTIMGHVDHGKTTLMDALRRRSLVNASSGSATKKKKSKAKAKSGKSQTAASTDIAGTEAGGITQIISAFQVPLEGMDQTVTFLDTPGHAAFRAMRQSGSDAADIIVLVVAADDGVSKQTVEIIEFYKSIVREAGENGISLVVAMNKIDKPGIDVEEARRRIESQLQEHGILAEGIPAAPGAGFGLPVEIYPVSGLTGEGLDDLIEGLSLQAEVMDLRADDNTRAEGLVMDARVDKGVGIVVDTIIRWGSISKGDVVVSGTATGKVRLLKDMNDQLIKQGLPSQPVRIIGFDSVPKAGDPIVCVESEEVANDLVERRAALESSDDRAQAVDATEVELQSSGKHLLHHEWREKLQVKHGIDGESESIIRIPVIIKADADGTLAAVRESLTAIGDESSHNLIVDPVRVGVGPVLASDIQLAKEGGATIFAFNLKHEQTIASMADAEKVKLVTSKVIYSLLEDAKVEFANYLPAEPVEVVHGRAQVQAVFEIGGLSDKVAGLRVTEGTLFKDKAVTKDGVKLQSEYRILRDGKVISDTTFTASSLKYFKNDVNEVGRGKECGLSLTGCSLFEEGDEIECFSIEMKREFV